MNTFTLKSSQFRKERERSWRELDHILQVIQEKGLMNLSAKDLHQLPVLYRSAVSSLSVARAISLDKNLLDYLEGLVSRAYLFVYSNKRPPKEVIAEFLASRFPRAVFLYWKFVAFASGLLTLGFLCGFVLTLNDPERYVSFVPSEVAQGHGPASSTESLKQRLYSENEPADGLTRFASFLFTHNAKIGILCFSLGFAAGLPVVLLLFYNGLILGAMTALYYSRGLGAEFLAWVMGHGVTELAALFLGGAAGLVLGNALMFPGQYTRSTSLALHGRKVVPMVIGAVLMFFVAAVFEGYFRQLVHVVAIRWLVAGGTLFFWVWYFAWVGRKHTSDAGSNLTS